MFSISLFVYMHDSQRNKESCTLKQPSYKFLNTVNTVFEKSYTCAKYLSTNVTFHDAFVVDCFPKISSILRNNNNENHNN